MLFRIASVLMSLILFSVVVLPFHLLMRCDHTPWWLISEERCMASSGKTRVGVKARFPPHLRSAKLTLDNFPLAFMWAVKACSCLCPHCPLSSFSFDAALFFELLKCFFLLGVSAVFVVQFLLLLFFPVTRSLWSSCADIPRAH